MMLTLIDYIAAGAISCAVGFPLVLLVRFFARKFGFMDHPDGVKKKHAKPTALLGGVAVIIAFALTVWFYVAKSAVFWDGNIKAKHVIGILIGAGILLIGGIIDDKFNLKARWQFIFPVLAVIAVIASGIGIDVMSNPVTGEPMYLNAFKATVLWWQGVPYRITFISDIFTLLWLLGMIYTTKLLDGADGLVSGLAVIGSLFIMATTLLVSPEQSTVALLAMMAGGAFLAFLNYNWKPASIFLGESGSTFAGFILGVLSILSGSKIAVTLMLMGIPVLDVVWAIIRRWRSGQSFKNSDRHHIHHQLLDAGFSVKQTVYILYAIAIVLGSAALGLQEISWGIALLAVITIAFYVFLQYFISQRIGRRGLK